MLFRSDYDAVYYTNDAGRNWELRNCGINQAHLDDIWFINANTAWIAGTKVYKLSPDKHLVSRDELDFGTACLPLEETGMVFLKNLSFFQHNAVVDIIEDNEGVFSLVSPLNGNVTVSSCDSVPVVVSFSPTEEKNYTGKLRILINGKEFLVSLKGNAYLLSAAPGDTLLDFGRVPCGKTVKDTVLWQTDKNNESINSVFVVYGPNNIKYLSDYPATLYSHTDIPSVFSVQPADTGWAEAKFGFKMLPCKINKYITVRVYGISPIIESEQKVGFDLNCVNSLIDTIPVSNRGNEDLIITTAYLNDFSKGFSFLGWTSKKPYPIILKPGESDSVIIRYDAKINSQVLASLIIRNNDVTTKNGDKDPYRIDFRGEVLSVRLQAETSIDFGDVCLGSAVTLPCKIKNLGNMESSMQINLQGGSEFSADLTGIGLPMTLKPGDSATVNIAYSPISMGDNAAVIKLYDEACGDSVLVNIRGRGISSAIEAEPAIITATMQTNVDTVKKQVIIRNTGNMPANVKSYYFNPPIGELYHKLITPIPFVLGPAEEKALEFEFSGLSDFKASSQICFEADSFCPAIDCSGLELLSHSNWLDIAPDSVIFGLVKCPGKYSREIKIINMGNSEESITQIEFLKGGIFAFSGLPALPELIKEGDSLVFSIEFVSAIEGIFVDTILIKSVNKTREKEYYAITRAEFRTPHISLETDAIDFGILEKCDTARQILFKIFNTGSYPDSLTISAMNGITGYVIKPGNEANIGAKDSATVTVVCYPDLLAPGSNSETLTLKSTVCDTAFNITVNARIISPMLSSEPDELDFGSVWPGEKRTLNFTVKNNSGYDKWIDSVVSDSRYFTHNLPAPLLLQNGVSKQAEATFASPGMGNYTAKLWIYERRVCRDSSFIGLMAESPEEVYDTELSFDHHNAVPGDPVVFTLHFRHEPGNLLHDLTKLGVSGIDYKFEFDNYLFYPTEVFVYSGGNFVKTGANIEFGAISGSLDSAISHNLLLESRDIMRINGIALASVPNSTMMEITGFNIETPKSIPVTKKDGSLTVSGYCMFEASHKIKFKDTYFQLISTATNNKLELKAKLEKAGIVEIEIYDLIGSLVLADAFSAAAGTNTREIDITTIPNGTYLIKLESGGDVYVFKAVVVK